MRENEKQALERRIAASEARERLYASVIKMLLEAKGQSVFLCEQSSLQEAAASYELVLTTDRNALTPQQRMQVLTWGELVIVQIRPPGGPVQTSANEERKEVQTTKSEVVS